MKIPLTIIFTITFILNGITLLYAQTSESLDSLKAKFEMQAELSRKQFENEAAAALQEYEEYNRQAIAELNQYVSSIGNVWGKENILLDSKTEWVEYGPDFKDRSIVDFDSGTVTVEIVLDTDMAEDSAIVNKMLENAVKRLLESKGSSCPYNSVVDISEPLTNRPILEGLIDIAQYESYPESATDIKEGPVKLRTAPPSPIVKSKRIETVKKEAPVPVSPYSRKYLERKKRSAKLENRLGEETRLDNALLAKAIVEKSNETAGRSVNQSEDGTYTVKISFNLASDNLSKNAALYTDLVMEYAEKFNIEPALIFAVMEQESRFNPEATSWVPAYGLMQLVPQSGGYDAYKYVYGKEWIPTRSYLFNPRNNIELGTAYLRVLFNQFLKVTDPDCRRLCVIAGYNTGAGNVSRAFTGNTNLSKAFGIINSFDYSDLYNHLKTELNSEEARNYVTGVSGRMKKYIK